MLSNVERGTRAATDERSLSSPDAGLRRKIWLPRFVYDCMPYFYLTAGISAVFSTLYINSWFWTMPHYCLFAAACLHLGIKVLALRHRGADAGKEADAPMR
jgi:hypothetical protein